jgi:GR25 family glycosyltransferase involved in LPS biosynthesis
MPSINSIKEAYYINLDEREDRRQYIEAQIARSIWLKPICKRWGGINGRYLNPRDYLDILNQQTILDIESGTIEKWGTSMTYGALGCLLTYFNLFEKISAGNSPVLTLEDDAVFAPNFDTNLEKIIKELPEDFDFCYLGYGDTKFTQIDYSESLFIPRDHFVCWYGMIFSPKGASKLLDILPPVRWQLDGEVSKKMELFNTYAVKDRLVLYNDFFESNIQGISNCVALG